MTAPQHKTIRRLTYFAAIANAGSIRAAARELGLSVPVLSTALAELEDELGISLATRSTRSFKLTSTGRAVYEKTQSILTDVDSIKGLATTDRQLEGHLGLTLPIELTASWLPERLAAYRSANPKVELTIDARDELLELRDTNIDIAVRVNFATLTDQNPVDECLKLVCVSAHEPAFSIDGNQVVVDMPFLICPGSREWIHANCTQTEKLYTIKGTSLIHVSNRWSALALASHGLGFTLVTKSAASDYMNVNSLAPMFPEWDFGDLNLRYVFRDDKPSAEAIAFHQMICEAH